MQAAVLFPENKRKRNQQEGGPRVGDSRRSRPEISKFTGAGRKTIERVKKKFWTADVSTESTCP
jgi:hypothetical protein